MISRCDNASNYAMHWSFKLGLIGGALVSIGYYFVDAFTIRENEAASLGKDAKCIVFSSDILGILPCNILRCSTADIADAIWEKATNVAYLSQAPYDTLMKIPSLVGSCMLSGTGLGGLYGLMCNKRKSPVASHARFFSAGSPSHYVPILDEEQPGMTIGSRS